jgi:hypothetical protein
LFSFEGEMEDRRGKDGEEVKSRERRAVKRRNRRN